MSEGNDVAPAAAETSKIVESSAAIKTEENGDSKAQVDEKSDLHRDEKKPYKYGKSTHQERRDKYMSSSKNVRTDYASLPETDDPDEIRKQVEFYFSDSNLYYDDHMRQRVLGNKDDQYGENHAVSIKEIHSFKRMKRFQPYSAVVAALKESKTLDVLGDKEDLVQRKTALEKPADDDQEFGDPTIPRAIYAKGFGEEGRTTQFDIEAFFTPYGPLNSVRLRRSFPERIFKGSVFVEFESEELQKEFLAIDPKPKFEGQELVIKSKRQYCDEKMEDVKSGKIQSNKRHMNFKGYYHDSNRNGGRDYNNDSNRNSRGGRGRGGRGGRRGDRDRHGGRGGGGRDRDDWRGRRDDFQHRNGDRDSNGGDRRSRKNYNNNDNTDDVKDEAKQVESKKQDISSGDIASAAAGAEEANAAASSSSKKRERGDDAVEASGAKKVKAEEGS